MSSHWPDFEHNLRVADEVRQIAAEVGATPAQVSLAWLLAQGGDIAPIPGTKRVSRLEENAAAADLQLTARQLDQLTHITPPAGGRPQRGADARARPLTLHLGRGCAPWSVPLRTSTAQAQG